MGEITDAYAALSRAQKKRASGAPAYSVFVNRPVGRLLAACAYAARFTPNGVTGISAAFSAAGIVLIAFGPGEVWVGPVVWLLLALGYAWDSADGQVARLQGGGSLAGEWLDHVVDAAKISALHLAVLVGAARWFGTLRPELLVPVLFAIVANTTFFAMLLNDLLKQKRGLPTSAEDGGARPLRSVLLLPTDYGVLCLCFVLWGWWPDAFAVVYALLFLAALAFLGAAGVKWFRDLRSIDRR